MYDISELSKKFTQKYLTTTDIFDLLSEDISKESILKFLEPYKGNDLEIPTKEIYTFICENKDLAQKCMNSILNKDVKLFLRIQSHTGSWYSDTYTPYCCQTLIKCSGPRMQLMDYGYKCPECKNEISFSGIRLNESPLNTPKEIFLNQNKNVFEKIENQLSSIGLGIESPVKVQAAGIYGSVQSSTENEFKQIWDNAKADEITESGKNNLEKTLKYFGSTTFTPSESQLKEIHEKRLTDKLKLATDEITRFNLFGKISLAERITDIKVFQDPEDMIESVSIGEETVDIHHKHPPTNQETDELISEISKYTPKNWVPDNRYPKIIIADDDDDHNFVNKDIYEPNLLDEVYPILSDDSNFENYLKDNNIELTDENRLETISKYLTKLQTNINIIICFKNEYKTLPKILKEGSYGYNSINKFIFVEDLLELPDNSIKNVELIRSISAWSIKNNSNILNNKIKTELQFAELYPHTHKTFNINPESFVINKPMNNGPTSIKPVIVGLGSVGDAIKHYLHHHNVDLPIVVFDELNGNHNLLNKNPVGPDQFKPNDFQPKDYQIKNKTIGITNIITPSRNIGKLRELENYKTKIKFKEKMEILNKETNFEDKLINLNKNWVSLNEMLEIFPDAFNIDSRDFHCINTASRKWSQEQKDKFSPFFENFNRLIQKYPNRFDYTMEELKTILIDLKQKSGGDVEWRFLSFNKFPKETNSWQLKYMEVIRISDDKFIVVHHDKRDNEPTLIKKEILTSEINMELLHAH